MSQFRKIAGITMVGTAATIGASAAGAAQATVPPAAHRVAAATAAAPVGAPGTWRQVFSDEFSTTSLNRSKWNTGWFGNGVTQAVNSAEVACYDPANIEYHGIAARMMLTGRAQTCGGKRQPVTGALLNTMNKFEFTYGYVEARMWIASRNGKLLNWPNFWLNGHTWPNDGEIDIMEGDQGQPAYHLHWGNSSAAQQMGSRAVGDYSGWHTFGVDWQRDSITFYYDGRKARAENTSSYGANPAPGKNVPGVPHYLLIGNSGSGSHPVTTASVFVDYVRVWQH